MLSKLAWKRSQPQGLEGEVRLKGSEWCLGADTAALPRPHSEQPSVQPKPLQASPSRHWGLDGLLAVG